MWVALGVNAVVTDYKGFVDITDAGAEVWYPLAGYRSAHPSDTGSLMSVQNKNGFVELWSSELEASETAYVLEQLLTAYSKVLRFFARYECGRVRIPIPRSRSSFRSS